MINQKKKLDIMVDIESLSTTNDATVFQIAAGLFDVKTGEVIMTFNKHANIAGNEEMVVSGSTLRWWMSQGKLLNELLMKETGDFSSDDLVKSFQLWVSEIVKTYGKSNVRLIGNGPTFDIMILRTHFERLNLENPIAFRNERCMRTMLQLASDKSELDHDEIRKICTEAMTKKGIKEKKHDAMYDTLFQIEMYHVCHKLLME